MSDVLPRRFLSNGVECVWAEDLDEAEAEVARLREALARVAEIAWVNHEYHAVDVARKALEEDGTGEQKPRCPSDQHEWTAR